MRGIPINYELQGVGRPILVLHGTPMDHRGMKSALEPVFASHNKGWSRIYLDLPGHGKTQGPEWIENNDQMLDFIIDFIDKVIPGQNFALLGESYGGYLARGLVHKLPSRIDGLFLWCAEIDIPPRNLPVPIVRVRDDKLQAQLNSDIEREMFRYLVIQKQETLDFGKAHLLPAFQIADQKFIQRVIDTKFSFDLNSKKFEKPTVIACGRQDFVVGYDDAYKILDNYPMGTMLIVDGAGHVLGITEGKALFDASIHEWIKDMELYPHVESRSPSKSR